ncbi:unnamed protein product, partial [Candidula unifasciata]
KSLDEYPKPEMPSENGLLEVLDSLVLLYHIAAHKQLGKLTEVKEHLSNARSVFEEKIIEQARQMVWIAKVIYSS